MALGLARSAELGVADRYRDYPDQVLLLLANDLISRATRDAQTGNIAHQAAEMKQAINERTTTFNALPLPS